MGLPSNLFCYHEHFAIETKILCIETPRSNMNTIYPVFLNATRSESTLD